MDQDIRQAAIMAYREAFRRFGPQCLWHMRPVETPGPDSLRAVARSLRLHGWKEEYVLARRMEEMCDALDGYPETHP